MRAYRSIFHDKNLNNLVRVDLELEDMVVEVEEDGQRESQAVEFDIKNGYESGRGHYTPAYIETPLLYEYSLASGGVTANMDRNALMIYGSRDERGAFEMLFKNYILTTTQDRGLSSGGRRNRFWYNLTGGMVATYRKVGRGLGLDQLLLKRDGQGFEGTESESILPNVWDNGDTCHGALSDVSRWGNNQGKSDNDPDTLAKSYELFKAGVGNTDLQSSNNSKRISNGVMLEIITEFQENYVDYLEDGEQRHIFTEYINSYKEGLRDRGLSNEINYNLNNLASILDKTSSFYVEDFA